MLVAIQYTYVLNHIMNVLILLSPKDLLIQLDSQYV